MFNNYIKISLLILRNRIKKYLFNKFKNIDDKSIVVENGLEDPITSAKIVVSGDIDYIPKISIIISINNDEFNLPKCLENVLNQTLKEIEIICIYNDLIDKSLNLIKNYSKKDKRITIIKCDSKHSEITRNAGLSIAKGKYLSFIDSGIIYGLNALEKLYNKIIEGKSDIIIFQSKSIEFNNGIINQSKMDYNLKLDLIPKKETFSVSDISNYIFEFAQSATWDKLFKTEFIRSNNIRFNNIINNNDAEFTYFALCNSRLITIINETLAVKRYKNQKALQSFNVKDINNIVLQIDIMRYKLENKDLFKLVSKNFWKWAFDFYINQLKTLDKESKECFYNILHRKLNIFDYFDEYPKSSKKYKALNYIKYNNAFPTINILYIINKYTFNFFLVSLVSLLENSEYEYLNIILLYNDNFKIKLNKVNKLKRIRTFTLYTHTISGIQFHQQFSSSTNKILFLNILVTKFTNINKVLYLDCKTIIRKTLLPLWEINMKKKLIAAVEDISFSKDKAKNISIKDNFYFNCGVILLNCKEWRKLNLYNNIDNYNENKKTWKTSQDNLNFIADKRKIRLNPEFNYMELMNDTCQYDYEYLELYKNIDPIIFHFNEIKSNNNKSENLHINEFFKYYHSLKTLQKFYLTIPIVLYSDDEYTPFMYTTMISILENAGKTTFYSFYLFVPSNFSIVNKNIILNINDKYKCNINFIYMKKTFENINTSHKALSSYYRLLVGDLLPKELDKCIFLDVDICVCKDLSELFNIDIKDNYIAGVIDPDFYTNNEFETN